MRERSLLIASVLVALVLHVAGAVVQTMVRSESDAGACAQNARLFQLGDTSTECDGSRGSSPREGPFFTEVAWPIVTAADGATHRDVYLVYMVTYATNLAQKGFCLMSASAVSHGFRLNVLCEGRQKQFDEGFTTNERLWSIREFVTDVLQRT